MILPVGAIVTVEAPGSRASDGETQIIPGVVMKQYPDAPGQPLDIYAFHFEGVPSLMRAVPCERVKVVSVSVPVSPPELKYSLVPSVRQ